MKKTLWILIFGCILAVTYLYNEEIVSFCIKYFGGYSTSVTIEYKNEYSRNYDFIYVQPEEDLFITKKEDLLNIYYSIINSGIDSFSFYCDDAYKDCLDDVVYFANNQSILSNINSFVHPYNSFSKVETEYDTLGKITVIINKTYTKEKIKTIDDKIDEIIKNQVKKETKEREIIKIIHNYIINNTRYDSDRSDKNILRYDSSTAYGVLIEGYGLCGGYTDAMALFLNRYNIPNFKVISENHIWNAVYIENTWYHLDLTWDDPVVSDGSNALEYTFFLITSEELEERETTQHEYDKTVFKELEKSA